MARDTKIEIGSSTSSGLSLAQRLQDGSDGAWRELVELYGPLVDSWCRKSSVPVHAIPDIAQEVFITAFRSLGQFDASQPNATFRGWLWTIARSRIVDHFRIRANKQPARGGSTALADMQSLMDPLPLDEPTEVDQAASLLHRALEQIRVDFAANTWDLFWRTTVLGHPTDLVAGDNSVTTAAVRQAKSRVLRKLRKQLGDTPNAF